MDNAQLTQYLPVVMLGLVAVLATGGMMVMSELLGKKNRRNPVKDTPYECGIAPTGSGAPRFSVHFYLVAMLFILFDVEVVFLYPWAVTYQDLLKTHAAAVFGGMLSFMAILFVGYLYALKKKAFDWGQ